MSRVFFTDRDLGKTFPQILREAGLIVVGKAPYAELAGAFVSTLPRIASFLDSHQPPLIAKVYRPSPAEGKRRGLGRLELWFP